VHYSETCFALYVTDRCDMSLSLVVYKGLLHACVNRLRGGGMGYDLRHTNLTYKNGFKDCVWLTRVDCMYFSNTTLFDGRGVYIVFTT